jgi:hypothetical protein
LGLPLIGLTLFWKVSFWIFFGMDWKLRTIHLSDSDRIRVDYPEAKWTTRAGCVLQETSHASNNDNIYNGRRTMKIAPSKSCFKSKDSPATLKTVSYHPTVDFGSTKPKRSLTLTHPRDQHEENLKYPPGKFPSTNEPSISYQES